MFHRFFLQKFRWVFSTNHVNRLHPSSLKICFFVFCVILMRDKKSDTAMVRFETYCYMCVYIKKTVENLLESQCELAIYDHSIGLIFVYFLNGTRDIKSRNGEKSPMKFILKLNPVAQLSRCKMAFIQFYFVSLNFGPKTGIERLQYFKFGKRLAKLKIFLCKIVEYAWTWLVQKKSIFY